MYICRVGQNRIYTPYITVYLMISLPKIPYIYRIYMVLANPIHMYISGNMHDRHHDQCVSICVNFYAREPAECHSCGTPLSPLPCGTGPGSACPHRPPGQAHCGMCLFRFRFTWRFTSQTVVCVEFTVVC